MRTGTVHVVVEVAGCVHGVEWARFGNTDGLELRAERGHDNGGCATLVVEQLIQGHDDRRNVGSSDSERGGGEADLLVKVCDLDLVESHEPGLVSHPVDFNMTEILWMSTHL